MWSHLRNLVRKLGNLRKIWPTDLGNKTSYTAREISIKTHFYEVRQLINKWQLIEIGVFE